MPNSSLASAVARAFVAGGQTVEEVSARASVMLGRNWRWLRTVVPRYLAKFAGDRRPRQREVARFLLRDLDFQNACVRYPVQLRVAHGLTEQPAPMQPVGAAQAWDVPAIETTKALADWLFLNTGGLDWFADLKGLGYSQSGRLPLRHYHYRVLAKKSGGVRLIEIPKPRLKEVQRQILAELLDKIPAHPAVHGFRKGRSIRTFVTPHVGQRVVLRMDLQDFFTSISGARIQTFFRVAGYPEAVADRLGGICTNATPRAVWRECENDLDARALWDAWKLYARPLKICRKARLPPLPWPIFVRIDSIAAWLG